MKINTDASVFIAKNAHVAGDVTLFSHVSVWYSATVRADMAPISVGANSNIQDGAVIHCDDGIPCIIGENVTIGHGAIVHSAIIGDSCIIGMGAIILNNAKIGKESIVGAGALVTQGKEFPPRSLIVGSPAKVSRELRDDEIAHIAENALHYAALAQKENT